MYPKRLLLMVMFGGALALSGCGEDGPELGRVEGTVTMDGKPLPNASVVFVPENGRPAGATTDAQGKYVLNFTAGREGALLGKNTVRISTSRGNGGQVQLDVCDNGPGVDPRIAAQMFHPFCTTKPAGTGLGLAISHSIARAHGGHLAYVPGSARGAQFRLSLPRSSGES